MTEEDILQMISDATSDIGYNKEETFAIFDKDSKDIEMKFSPKFQAIHAILDRDKKIDEHKAGKVFDESCMEIYRELNDTMEPIRKTFADAMDQLSITYYNKIKEIDTLYWLPKRFYFYRYMSEYGWADREDYPTYEAYLLAKQSKKND